MSHENAASITPIESSNLQAVAYNEEEEELVVQFRNGQWYLYEEVPYSVFRKFIDAPSKGQFFSANIRNVYDSSKVDAVLQNMPGWFEEEDSDEEPDYEDDLEDWE